MSFCLVIIMFYIIMSMLTWFFSQEEDTKIGRCFVFNPVLPCPLFLSLSVDDIDVVDCVIETMRQVSDRMVNLVKFLSS